MANQQQQQGAPATPAEFWWQDAELSWQDIQHFLQDLLLLNWRCNQDFSLRVLCDLNPLFYGPAYSEHCRHFQLHFNYIRRMTNECYNQYLQYHQALQ